MIGDDRVRPARAGEFVEGKRAGRREMRCSNPFATQLMHEKQQLESSSLWERTLEPPTTNETACSLGTRSRSQNAA